MRFGSTTTALLLALCAASASADEGGADDLAPPVRLEAGGAPIDVDVGHAAPFLWDMDGDGKRDLLVGQFGGGKLRVYTNVGEDAAPAFKEHTWFQAGGATATVPYG